ncbi:hypothetical protein H6G00_31645 [Leptolyngbya sp. FACHB-541]|uniref:hypothetical protein n=1 Tax=Leptolyngbya sp. FACHB-541 TaxID=2692810 RepID=UPI001681C89A|nr:hypothetical protein [Leptolyngbya sp. FACHB-541]MBD2001096.1 hypothetical protein [Leptolyngbya sp. FACHB-541]
MNIEIPNGFEFQRVYCYPNPDQPLSYYYLPLQPQPQRSTDGTPMINLISMGTSGYLQLSMSWEAPSETLDALRQEIAQRENLDNPAVLRFAFAPVTVQQVSLLSNKGERWEAIATSRSSGFPPYTALFNAHLNAEQQTQAAAALNGRKNCLQVEYLASLNGVTEASANITGNAANVIAQLKDRRETLNQNEVQEVLKRSIDEGELQLTVIASEDASPQLIEQVSTHVLTQSADLLLRFLQGEERIPDITHFRVTVSKTEPQQIDLSLKTEVANWFPNGSSFNHIQPAPGGTSSLPSSSLPPPSPSLPVQLNFFPTEAPLALITVQQGTAKTTLIPPDFSTTLSNLREEPLEVETSYTFGGTFSKNISIPASGKLSLSPADLGLTQVTVDATALEAAGAKKARIRLHYHPDGNGVEDETTIYLRDRSWKVNWFVISRGDDLQGFLQYEWQVTLENGDLVKHEMTETTSPHIVLTVEEQAE